MSKVLAEYKKFKLGHNVPKEHETLVARAICAGWVAAKKDSDRHEFVRRKFRGIIARLANMSELPY